MRIIPIVVAVAATLATAGAADSREFNFRFGGNDKRGDVEGKRASCEVYARIAQVQADANQRFKCRFSGPRWDRDIRPHFQWCRWAPRRAIADEQRGRADQLQDCFNQLGDFDDRR